MEQKEYHEYEMKMLSKQMEENEKAPLAERKEAYQEWLAALQTNADLVAERIEWLLNGTYGYGAYVKSREIVKNPRMNRIAALSQLVASMEWRCPGAMARKAWNELDGLTQERIQKSIESVIEEAEESTKEENMG